MEKERRGGGEGRNTLPGQLVNEQFNCDKSLCEPPLISGCVYNGLPGGEGAAGFIITYRYARGVLGGNNVIWARIAMELKTRVVAHDGIIIVYVHGGFSFSFFTFFYYHWCCKVNN